MCRLMQAVCVNGDIPILILLRRLGKKIWRGRRRSSFWADAQHGSTPTRSPPRRIAIAWSISTNQPSPLVYRLNGGDETGYLAARLSERYGRAWTCRCRCLTVLNGGMWNPNLFQCQRGKFDELMLPLTSAHPPEQRDHPESCALFEPCPPLCRQFRGFAHTRTVRTNPG